MSVTSSASISTVATGGAIPAPPPSAGRVGWRWEHIVPSYQTALDVNEAHSIGVNFRPFCTGGVFVPHVARPRWNASPGSHARRHVPSYQTCRAAADLRVRLQQHYRLRSCWLAPASDSAPASELAKDSDLASDSDLAPKRIEHPNGLSTQTDLAPERIKVSRRRRAVEERRGRSVNGHERR